MIVADGFVGNVVLKTGEGMIADLAMVMRETLLGGNLLTKLGARDARARAARIAPEVRLRNLRRRAVAGAARQLHRHPRARESQRDPARDQLAAMQEANDVIGKITEMMAPPHPAAEEA